MVSRDLDSRFSARELAAVTDWLDHTDFPVHVMRDNPAHFVPMLGALWGCDLRRHNARGRWFKSWVKILKDSKAWAPRTSKGPDQEILKKYVWPWARSASAQHDAYFCGQFGSSRAFPTRRLDAGAPNNFVGAVAATNGSLSKRCPPACRPKLHPEWVTC